MIISKKGMDKLNKLVLGQIQEEYGNKHQLHRHNGCHHCNRAILTQQFVNLSLGIFSNKTCKLFCFGISISFPLCCQLVRQFCVPFKLYFAKKRETARSMFFLKGALSGLRQFLITESSLKMMKNVFYFVLKAVLVLKIFQLLS